MGDDFRRFMGTPWATAAVRRGTRVPGGVAAVAYNPLTDLPSLAEYWRADLGTAFYAGAEVQTWTDQESSIVLTSPSVGSDPHVIAEDATFGGLASMDFTAHATSVLRDDAADAAFRPLHDGTGVTLLIDLIVEAGQTGNGVIIDNNTTSATAAGILLRYEDAATGVHLLIGNGSSTVINITGTMSKGARHTLVIRYASTPATGNDADMRVDGTSVASQAAESATPAAGNSADVLSIGNRSAATTQQLIGRIREIAICNAYLSAEQVEAWESYTGA